MSTVLFRAALTGLLLPMLLLIASFARAQNAPLPSYIEWGLRNNLLLQEKNMAVEKAVYALRTAESLFLPTVAFQGAYQSGQGGRSIDLPIGDLLNPVYTTLNQLTSSNKFAAVENVHQDFLPHHFYDAKVRASLPLVHSELRYSRQIEASKVKLREWDVAIYRHELVRAIRVAYYNYLAAREVVQIYESALQLARENARTNERLQANGKGLPALVLRARSEIENGTALVADARKTEENARLYFNFLLNRDPGDSIEASAGSTTEFTRALQLAGWTPDASRRPELKALEEAGHLQGAVLKMHRKFRTPKLSAFVDLGLQGQNLQFSRESRYYFAGLQLDIPLFSGRRNLYGIRQSELGYRQAQVQTERVGKELRLGAEAARNNLIAVSQGYQSSLKSLEAAASYQKLVEKGYREGIHSFIEDIDARSLLTSARLQLNISRYRVLTAAAEYEHATASSSLSD